MALKKIKNIKGFEAEYWKMTSVKFDLMNLKIISQLDVFKDITVRQSGQANSMGREVRTWGIMDFPLQATTIEERYMEVASKTFLEIVSIAYIKWKESDIQQRPLLDEYGMPQYDENNQLIMEDYEANWFADAEDVIEV